MLEAHICAPFLWWKYYAIYVDYVVQLRNTGKVILGNSRKKLNWRNVYIARNRNLKTRNRDDDAPSLLKGSWENIAGFRWFWKRFSESSESSDSGNDILEEDSVISEGNSTDSEQKLGDSSKMFLTDEKLTLAEQNDIDFIEGPYNNVLEPENNLISNESQGDNNEKPGKSKEGKRKAPNNLFKKRL